MRIRNRRRPGQIRTRRMHVERLEDRQLLSIVPGLLGTGVCDNQGDIFAIDIDYQDLGNSDVEYLGRLTGPTGYEDLTVRDIAYTFSGDTFYGIGDDVDTYPPYTPVGWPSLLATADVDIVTPPPSGEIGFTILGGLLNPEQDMSGQLLPVWANALEVNPANGKLYAAGAHMEVGLPPSSNHYAIYEVDVASAAGLGVPTTPVVDLGTYQSAGGIAFDDDGYLYLTTTDSALLKVDVLSATPAIVGEVVSDTGYGDFDGLTRGFGGGEFFGFRHDGTVYDFDVPGNDSTQVGSEALWHAELDDLYGATVAFMEPVAITGPIDGLELVDQQPVLGQLWYEFQADNDGDLSVDLTAGGTLMTLYGYDAVGEEWVELDSDAMEVGVSDAQAGGTYVLHVEELTGEADLRFHNGGGAGVIGEFVWHDLNADGIQQVGEPGAQNVGVELFDAGPDGLYGGGDDVSMGTDTTDTSGFYGFGGLPAGTYYLEFSSLPAGCAFTLQDVGADDAVDSDVRQAGFLAGLTDVFTLADGATDDTRDAGIVDAFSSPTVIPGTVEFEVLEDQVPDAHGQLRYQFTSSREGMVSARVDYAGDCLMALYDSDQNLLDLDTSSQQQVDYAEAYAGDVFYLHVAGLATPADVVVANLLEYDMGTGSVTVHGTDGPDEFTGVYQAAPNPHEMWINGFYYDSDWFFFELNEIAFDGGDGDDTAVISGSDQSDEGVLGPYSATMYANGDAASHEIKLEVSHAESIDVDAAGGEDTGTLNGGAGMESLDLWPGYFEWEGNPFSHIVRNVETLTANAAGDDDTASMHDSAGADDFEADPDSATLSGPGYSHTVNNFRWVYAFASDDGETDTATLDDLPGSEDLLRCWSTEAKMIGTGFFNRAKGFDEVVASASDASDQAELNDSSGADFFEAYADRATITYPGGKTVEAEGFRHVYAFASDDGETDTAYLYDTTADLGTSYPAWFQAEADASKMYYGTLFFNRAKGFDEVIATAVHGNNKGRMYDSLGADTFEAYADRATMSYAGGPIVRAEGIRWLSAYGSDDGETDTAYLYDTTADLGTSYASWFKGYHGEGKMYEASTFYNRVDDFDEVIASAVGGNDKTRLYDSPGDDAFDGYADRSTMSYSDGTVVRADGFRWLFAFASDDGETDTARLYDTTADLGTSYASWFKGFNDLSKMYEGSTFYIRVDDFNEVIASAVGGDDTAKLYDSPGADALEAYADQATMSYPDGTVVRADDFRWVLGYGSDDGQVDTAQFYDTTADLGTSYATWFKADDDIGRLYADPVFYVQAQQFDRVSATAVGDDDTAKLFDSALDDAYWSRPDHSRMEYADGTYAEAFDFRYVLSYSQNGSDTATLYDETAGGTSYAARFAGYATWAKLFSGAAFYSRTEGFAELRAALGGGDDLAWVEDDPARVDHLLVTFPGDVDHAAAKAKLSNAQRAIYIDDFHTLTATTSQDSVDDADIDPAHEDDVILDGNWAEAP